MADLKNFRQFYLTFAEDEKGYTLCSLLSWSHIRLIMRIDNVKARTYYLTESKAENWSVRQLQRNINSCYYERLLSSSDKEGGSALDLPETTNDTRDFIKDPYVLEFLNLPEHAKLQESRFEQAIISNLQAFLLEMGKGFSFVARQFRISTETSHFYIDLVFYNYLLKCFVIIDLKTGKLTHQDIGRMDMYVRMFDEVNLRSQRVDVFEQEKGSWQQLLYFKERFVAKDHPLRSKWEKYSLKLRKVGLHENMGLGPSKEEFLAMLEAQGLTLHLNKKRK